MLEFEELFARRDPYSTFATALAKPAEQDVTAPARGLIRLARADHGKVLSDLRDSRPGLDVRWLTLFATESEAYLADLHGVHEMVTAHIALALPTLRSDEGFGPWLHEQAAAAVRAVVAEDAEHARKKAEVPYPLSDHFASIHDVLDIPLENLRHAAACINDLPRERRIPLVRIFLQAIQPGQVVLELGTSFMQVLEDAKAGIRVLQNQRVNKLPGERG